ncbi:hypothetical protein FQR65_LT06116 [Abscondita terminalis]|nr:hypothetical protein FQR65_LT06116 [Abscondita terminalis]
MIWYVFPEQFKDLKHHTVLFDNQIILNATKAIRNVNGYRKFEEECERFKIYSDDLKIQSLRLFLLGSANDWYETNLKKVGLGSVWDKWKDSFYNVFVDKGWSIIRKAFSYKYLGGSLIDYALVKEKLTLEVEPKSSEISRVNQIVFGLPNEVQDQLDREELTSIDKLYTALRKLEDNFSRRKRDKHISSMPFTKSFFSTNKKK